MTHARRAATPSKPDRGRCRRDPRLNRACRFVLRECCSAGTKVVSLLLVAALVVLLLLDGSSVVLPRFGAGLKDWAQARSGAPEISVGSIGFDLSAQDATAGLTFNDVEVSNGELSVHLPRVSTSFNMLDGLQGRFRPREVAIDGGRLTLTRDAAGALFLNAGIDGSGMHFLPAAGSVADAPAAGDLGAFLNAVAQAGDAAMLSDLASITVTGVAVALIDARSKRAWRTETAQAGLRRDGDGMVAGLDASFAMPSGPPVRVSARMATALAGGESEIKLAITDAAPADLATQVRALDWMRLIEGRVSGHLVLRFDPGGALTGLAGVLEAGPGAIVTGPGQRIGFDGAKGYFTYDPARDMLTVEELRLASAIGDGSLSGKVWLKRGDDGAVSVLTAQMAMAAVTVTAPQHLGRDLHFDGGAVTARVRVDPFRVEIGEARLHGAAGAVALSGRAVPRADHWDIALDAAVTGMTTGDALDIWPAAFRPNVRQWVANHIEDGVLRHLGAHVRTVDGAPQFGLDLAFEKARARILDGLPVIEHAAGTLTLVRDRLALVLDAGRTDGGDGRMIDLAGSRLAIADVEADVPIGVIDLAGRGAIPSMLALINQPLLRLMDRVGQGTDIADGMAEVAARLTLPLLEDVLLDDVGYTATAALTGVRSAALVPGHSVDADRLTLAVDAARLTLAGPARLSGVPLDFTYERALDGNPDGTATVTGTLPVTAKALAALGIALPAGSLGGRGQAAYALDLAGEEAPPRYRVVADLGGASLAIPALRWAKPAGPAASLTVSGELGDSPSVRALALTAPGLAAKGSLTLAGERLRGARFSRLAVGGWLDAPVTWRIGAKADTVDIRGGRIDLRDAPVLGGAGKGAMALTLAPDVVTITDDIRLTGLRGEIATGARTRGRFSARINGGSPIEGVIRDGGKVYLESRDGGQALRDAGLFANVTGGVLRVSLDPIGQGTFDGRLSLQGARAIGAPVLAEMLAVTNLFGLIDRLFGPGIGFDDVQGWFTLGPDRITVTRARAIGPSLGLTLAGIYDTRRDRLDMEGVVSPFYAVNGLVARIPVIGRVLGGRPGEGVVGATFRVSGTAAEPRSSVNPLSLLTPGAAREMFMTRPALQPALP